VVELLLSDAAGKTERVIVVLCTCRDSQTFNFRFFEENTKSQLSSILNNSEGDNIPTTIIACF
jgi:hypothetical protein